MRKSWNFFFRRIASVCFVCGATAWSSAMCYAQIAADNALDPVYAKGWQAGDNGFESTLKNQWYQYYPWFSEILARRDDSVR